MREHTFDGSLFSAPEDCVLGIDPSLTGFAVTALSVSSDNYCSWVYRSPERGVERLADIVKWLEARVWHLNRTRSILDVAIEDGVTHSHSAFILGELHGVIKLAMLHLPLADGCWPLRVPPTSLKKYVAGKGTGVKKNEMLLRTYKLWGAEFTDDNAADSYGLAQIARNIYLSPPEGTMSKAQLEVLAKLNDPKFRDTRHVFTP